MWRGEERIGEERKKETKRRKNEEWNERGKVRNALSFSDHTFAGKWWLNDGKLSLHQGLTLSFPGIWPRGLGLKAKCLGFAFLFCGDEAQHHLVRREDLRGMLCKTRIYFVLATRVFVFLPIHANTSSRKGEGPTHTKRVPSC